MHWEEEGGGLDDVPGVRVLDEGTKDPVQVVYLGQVKSQQHGGFEYQLGKVPLVYSWNGVLCEQDHLVACVVFPHAGVCTANTESAEIGLFSTGGNGQFRVRFLGGPRRGGEALCYAHDTWSMCGNLLRNDEEWDEELWQEYIL